MNGSTPGFPVLHYLLEVCSNSSPLSQWCHPTISFSVVLFSSFLQSFPTSGSFLMSQLFASGGQSIGASASVLPMNIQDWFPLGLTGLISLQSKGLSSLLQRHSSEASILRCSAFFMVLLAHPYMTTGKTIVLTRQIFVSKVMSVLFNMLSGFVKALLAKCKRLVVSWLRLSFAVILEPKKVACHCFPNYFLWSDGTGCHDLSFLNVEL